MNGETARRYLELVCRRLDEGDVPPTGSLLRTLSPLALPAIVTLGLDISACRLLDELDPAVSMYGGPPVPAVEDCDDRLDNDGDGQVDCADQSCFEHEACSAVGVYGAPPMPRGAPDARPEVPLPEPPPTVEAYGAPFPGDIPPGDDAPRPPAP